MRKTFIFILLLNFAFSRNTQQTLIQSADIVISSLKGEESTRHITPYLLEIARNGHQLPGDKKEALKELGFNFSGDLVTRTLNTRSEGVGLDQTYDSGFFRYHYTTDGTNAVDSSDTNSNSIPDYIDRMATVFDTVAIKVITELGYSQPPGDGWLSSSYDKGGSGHYDVYVRNITSTWYGYAQAEYYAYNSTGNNEHSSAKEVNAFTSYMVMRNNYSKFSNSELENIKVTAAHEYYHAVQFGYDGWEEAWLMEATAVWMEETIYDEINDCYQYMPKWFSSPQKALDDESDHWYGSFIYFEYIREHLGGEESILRTWEKSITHNSSKGDYSHLAISEALETESSSFADALNKMVIANRILSSTPEAGIYSYEEAGDYPVNGPKTYRTITHSTGNPDTLNSTSLNRYASQYVRIYADNSISVSLTNISGPAEDLELNAIIKQADGNYTVLTGTPIVINPGLSDWIYLVIVSLDIAGGNWDYQLAVNDSQVSIDDEAVQPNAFTLYPNYPNPFNPSTSFMIQVSTTERLKISIFSIDGRLVRKITDDVFTIGDHVLNWDGKTDNGIVAASGTYFIRVEGNQLQHWQKITLLK